MTTDDTAILAVHDLTQGAWFGGMLMGAVALDAATRAVPDRTRRLDVADEAWRAWHRVSTPVILAHLAAGAALTYANKGRLATQPGAVTTTMVRTAATGAALAAEVYARRLGSRLGQHAHAPVTSSTTPSEETDEATASVQRRLRVAQWLEVGLTGAIVAIGARMGEQQRPTNVVQGAFRRLGFAA